MCRVLQISRSSYQYVINKGHSRRYIENQALTDIIQCIFAEYKQRYGSKRILRELENRGVHINHKRVERLMKENGLKAKYSCKCHSRYCKAAKAIIQPNFLNREFRVQEKNKIWVGDITYIPTREGYEYLLIFLDICTRKVVGWAMNQNMREQLALDALNNAFGREAPKAGLMIHTDRGAQFTSDRYRSLLKKKGVHGSMSRSGNPWDNAVMEAFNKSLKTELLDKKHPFETRNLARKAVFEYIEMFYNPKRLHSALGYKSPIEFEKLLFNP